MLIGKDGAPGLKGYKGDKGEPGVLDYSLYDLRGNDGAKGEPGLPGVTGYNGSKGEPGLNGVCECSLEFKKKTSFDGILNNEWFSLVKFLKLLIFEERSSDAEKSIFKLLWMSRWN